MATATKDESQLTDRQRQVLHLVRDEGMSHKDAAKVLGIGASGVSDQVSRLRKRGFMPRRRRGRPRGANSTAPRRQRATGRGARVAKQDGRMKFDHVPSLPKAMDEITGRMDEITSEQQVLTERQQRLAAELESLTEEQNRLSSEATNLGRVREGIEGALTYA